MKQTMIRTKVLILVLVLPVLAACSLRVAADAADQDADATSYGGALDLTYEGALDATRQLALGTLRLEDTDLAVTEAQAGDLLALWQVLTSGKLQSGGETNAVLKQIEAAMTADQVSAIAGLRLTQQDVQSWSETWGDMPSPGGMLAGKGQAFAGGQKPDSIGDMSDEEREQLRAQMQAQMPEMPNGERPDMGVFGGGQSMALTRTVVELLAERSGSVETQARAFEPGNRTEASSPQETPVSQGAPSSQVATVETDASGSKAEPEPAGESGQTEQAEAVEPEASETENSSESIESDAVESGARESVFHTVRAGDSLASIAVAYGVTVASLIEANGIQDANLITVGQELIIPDPSQLPDVTNVEPGTASVLSVSAAPEPALEQLDDTDPGPPLTIKVSANRATQDPLVEQSRRYLVTGIVRNDGQETYAVSAILATFFDAEGFRGTYDPAIRDGKVVSAEWNWHGQTEAEFAALLLAPGEEWPFLVATTAQDMGSFVLHPDAVVTERESLTVELSGVQVTDLGTYVRISGTATNGNAVAIKNVTVSGVLLDDSGQIVSLGSTYVLEEDIQPGDSVPFAVHIAAEPHARYQLYAQAERDWS